MKALSQLPAAQGIAAMQRINVVVLNPLFLALFVGTAALSLLCVVAGFFPWGETRSMLLLAAGLAYSVGSFGVTAAFNVPRNERLARMDAASDEAAAWWPVVPARVVALEPCAHRRVAAVGAVRRRGGGPRTEARGFRTRGAPPALKPGAPGLRYQRQKGFRTMPARAPWLLQWLCHGLVLLGLALGMVGAARGAVVLDDGRRHGRCLARGAPAAGAGREPFGLAAVLQRRDDFHVPQTARANLGVLKHPAWLRMPLEVAPGSDGHWVLEIDYPSLDRIDAWLLESTAASWPRRCWAIRCRPLSG